MLDLSLAHAPTDATALVPPPTALDRIADALHVDGYHVASGLFPDSLLQDLFLHFQSLDEARFKRAGIGKNTDFHLNRAIRGDAVCWLEPGHALIRPYFDWIETLRLGLNRRLLLGLFDYESHYAYYPEGAFYRKHLDAFRGNNPRRVTTLLYLNPAWRESDGGELLLYDRHDHQRVIARIQPTFGTFVTFLSEDFPHEVLPVTRGRYSLAGWFRTA